MRFARYVQGRLYDEVLEKCFNSMRNKVLEKDDDVLTAIIGATGTGKSRLALHACEYITQGNATIDCFGMDNVQFASALQYAKQMEKPKFLCYDEANVHKRDSMTKWNKELLALYLKIRGLNIIHLWCNPSINMLDRDFVEERLNGCIFVYSKAGTFKRHYYYFTQGALIKIIDKYKNLKRETLKKAAEKYALYEGWFRDYDGYLLEDYMDLKDARMDTVADDFIDKYGEKTLYHTKTGLARHAGVSVSMITERTKDIKAHPEYRKEYILETASGRKKFHPACIDILKKIKGTKRT